VHVHQRVELGLGGFGKRRHHTDAGIIDEMIEAVAAPGGEGLAKLCGEGIEGGNVAGVELKGRGAAAQRRDLGDSRIGLGLVGVIGEKNIGALSRQRQGGVAAKAAAGAGDEGDFIAFVRCGHKSGSLGAVSCRFLAEAASQGRIAVRSIGRIGVRVASAA
jgi:hypothetical protein